MAATWTIGGLLLVAVLLGSFLAREANAASPHGDMTTVPPVVGNGEIAAAAQR